MLPRFSGSGVPRTDASHVQSMHASAFPMFEFSESPVEKPLDLNFSQKGTQGTVRVQNETDDSVQIIKPEVSVTVPQEVVKENEVDGESVVLSGSKDKREDGVDASQLKTRGSVAVAAASMQEKLNSQWTLNEMIVLFEAKKVQAEKAESGPRKLRSSITGKWEQIAETCKASNVMKSSTHCREKWETLWPPFQMILNWESKVSEKKVSYWNMTEEERVRGGLPANFDQEIYNALSARFAFVATLDPASPILISLNVDSGGSGATSYKGPAQSGVSADSGKGLGQNGRVRVEDGQPMPEQKSAGRKRKTAERSKQLHSENTKAIVLLDPKEEGGAYVGSHPSKETRPSKSKASLSPLDLTERKLLLEERKMKLAEQRFLLEERKLEATIEIGKGLIASMERMTGTISSLGLAMQQQ
ncbi:hypothetical protein KP509_37G059000 [Ceratopteris richardii]|nr:hypothetical protein KP509_37G059000 [Ceratopteris richardii]